MTVTNYYCSTYNWTRVITLSKLGTFIRGSLRAKLGKDVSTFHMIREADVACCVYYHLRRYLRLDSTWRVFAERHSKVTGHIIDIMIFKKGSIDSRKCQNPRIAIELKWNRNTMPKKDRKSLDRCVRQLHVKKAYFISVLSKQGKQTIKKKQFEKYRLFEIYVRPKQKLGEGLQEWNRERKLFKEVLEESR